MAFSEELRSRERLQRSNWVHGVHFPRGRHCRHVRALALAQRELNPRPCGNTAQQQQRHC